MNKNSPCFGKSEMNEERGDPIGRRIKKEIYIFFCCMGAIKIELVLILVTDRRFYTADDEIRLADAQFDIADTQF